MYNPFSASSFSLQSKPTNINTHLCDSIAIVSINDMYIIAQPSNAIDGKEITRTCCFHTHEHMNTYYIIFEYTIYI